MFIVISPIVSTNYNSNIVFLFNYFVRSESNTAGGAMFII